MAGDALINTVLPGAGLAAMGVRAFGSAAQDARQRGADVATQMGCGAAVAGVEILSEKLFDGLAGIYGKGGADELVEKVIQGMTESEGGRKVLNFLASAFGEGFEEFFSGIIDPALETIIDGAPVLSHYDENTRADVIRSMIVGGILGGLGGAVELAGGQNAQTREAAEAAGAAAAEQTESKNAVPMGTAEDLLLTPEDAPGQTKSADSGKETAESTIVNDDPVQHTTVEQQAIEEYKNASDQTLAAFIQRVRGLQNQNYKNGVRQTILTKTDNAIVKAAELTGTDTTGYKNIINGSSIQHIDNRHGEHGKADHSMADIQDFSRIGYVLDHFTDAKIIPISELDPETRKLTKAWNNSDDTLAPMVQFSMPVNGVYYVVEAVPSSKAKVMAVISAFISSGNESDSTLNQVLNLPESPTSSLTPEANLELLGAVSHNVPQPAQTVNTQPVDMTRLLPPPEVVRAAMEGRPLTLGQTSSEAQPFDMKRLLPPPEVVQAAREGRPLTLTQSSGEAQAFDMTRLLPPPEVVQAAMEGRPLKQAPVMPESTGTDRRFGDIRGNGPFRSSTIDIDGKAAIIEGEYDPKEIRKAISQDTTNFVTKDLNDPDSLYGELCDLIPPLDGFFDLKMHGSPERVKVFGSPVDASELARIILLRRDYEGGPVRLLACETGKLVNDTCIAKELSRLIGEDVLAPTEVLRVYSSGKMIVRSDEGSEGCMRLFHPDGSYEDDF